MLVLRPLEKYSAKSLYHFRNSSSMMPKHGAAPSSTSAKKINSLPKRERMNVIIRYENWYLQKVGIIYLKINSMNI